MDVIIGFEALKKKPKKSPFQAGLFIGIIERAGLKKGWREALRPSVSAIKPFSFRCPLAVIELLNRLILLVNPEQIQPVVVD
jgi:hypothetical protein